MYFITKVPSIEGLESLDTIMDIDWKEDDTETVGYFRNLLDANRAVINGETNQIGRITEYVVIEVIPQGIYHGVNRVYWYRYNDNKSEDDMREYIPIEEVESVIVNFAEIG